LSVAGNSRVGVLTALPASTFNNSVSLQTDGTTTLSTLGRGWSISGVGYVGAFINGDATESANGLIIATTATSADSFVLNLIQEGSGSENRIGRKINLQSLRLKGLCELTMDNAATTGGLIPTPVRMVVVWDKQPSGSQPAFSTIFGIQDQTGTVSSDVFDPLKYTVTDRFQVLRDVIWTFNPMLDNVNGGTTDAVVYHKVFDEFINLKGKQSVYGASSSPSVVGDIQSGGLYVYFRAIYSVASTTSASISSDSWSRLRFLG